MNITSETQQTTRIHTEKVARTRLMGFSLSKTKESTDLLKELNALHFKYGKQHLTKRKRISNNTFSKRYRFNKRLVADLYELNCPVKFVKNIKPAHCKKLCRYWEASGLKPSSLANNMTLLRTVLSWVGKERMLDDIPKNELFVDPKATYRQEKTEVDKSMSAALENQSVELDDDQLWATSPLEVIEFLWPSINALTPCKKDKAKRYITMLELMYWFGLRPREAAFFKPEKDMFVTRYRARTLDGEFIYSNVWEGSHVQIDKKGAKGGRERLIEISSENQKVYLRKLSERLYCRHRIMPKDVSRVDTWLSGFNEFCRKNGLSKQNNMNPYSLRHEYAQRVYEEQSGQLSPIRAGKLYKVDKVAKQKVSKDLGHNRIDVVGAYIG